MAKESLIAAVISMNSVSSIEKNREKYIFQIKKAASLGAKLILLPEMFTIYGLSNYSSYGESDDSSAILELANLAKKYSCVIGGTVPEVISKDQDNSKKVYNTLYLFNTDGTILEKYRKAHLFNLTSQDGTKLYCESDSFVAGDQFKTTNIFGFKVALSICYDLRFSKMFHKMAKEDPFDILLVPSAFTLQTGMVHWETLVKSRGIEFQSYVLASDQTGNHSSGKDSFGHSMIIDPWGTKLCDTGPFEGLAIAEVDPDKITSARTRLPIYQNAREELYGGF